MVFITHFLIKFNSIADFHIFDETRVDEKWFNFSGKKNAFIWLIQIYKKYQLVFFTVF